MNFAEAIASGFRNYAKFEGRAARSEYWYWTLFVLLVAIAADVIDAFAFSSFRSATLELGPLGLISSLALLVPGLAVSVRRLHDIDRTGRWLLLFFTVVGIVLLMVWACFKGTAGPNRFGEDTLAGR
jgi:uncharacterized membrane protein YhaH (DUF805 family)